MRKPFRTQNAAVTAAFFIAPVVPALSMPVVGPWKFPPDVSNALLVYVVALPFIFALGLPLFLLFSRLGLFRWWTAIPVGTISGVALLALLGRFQMPNGHWLLMYSVVGAATGFLFWAIVTLGPEPSQSTARNWVDASRRRLGSKR
jgi:hypothetical protein